MRAYHFEFSSDEKVTYASDHEFEDDTEALCAARAIAGLFDVRVTRSGWFVAVVKGANERATSAS